MIWNKLSEENEHPEYIIRGTLGGIHYFGELEDHCYLGNEVKLYEHHVDTLFAMFWHKKGDNYVCTINKTFASQASACMFRYTILKRTCWSTLIHIMIHSWSGSQMGVCSPNVALCILLGTDKRATMTNNWSEFRRRANIREGDIRAFCFMVTSKRRLVFIKICIHTSICSFIVQSLKRLIFRNEGSIYLLISTAILCFKCQLLN